MALRTLVALNRTALAFGTSKSFGASRLLPSASRWSQPFSSSCGDSSDQLKKVDEYVRNILGGTKPDLSDVLEGNKKWVAKVNETDPTFFPKIGAGQSPHYLYIGCSDARVDPTILMGLDYGELFIHRNVGNVVSGNDLNVLTVIEFAVNKLQIPHIVVCGHYDCGAVRASSQAEDHGMIEYWLRNIRDLRRTHQDTLEAISDDEERHRKLVEINVVEQALNVMKTGCVQRKRRESQESLNVSMPFVHALVFDPAVGELKKLDVKWPEGMSQPDEVFDLYPKSE